MPAGKGAGPRRVGLGFCRAPPGCGGAGGPLISSAYRPKKLVEVVWTHEAAHFVSHIGVGGYHATSWENFSGANRDDEEHVAQIACWGAFTILGKPKLIRVMEKLAKYRSEVYNTSIDFGKECSNFSHDPLDIIARLTVKVGHASGRKLRMEREDIQDILGYDE